MSASVAPKPVTHAFTPIESADVAEVLGVTAGHVRIMARLSGTEIASDLAIDDSIRVTAALRKPRYVIPRVSRGVPSDWRCFTRVSAYWPMAFPMEAVADHLKQQVLDADGHPSQYGAPTPHDPIAIGELALPVARS